MKEGIGASIGAGRSFGTSVNIGVRGASFGVRSGEMWGMRTIASAPRKDSFSNFAVIRNTGIAKPSGFVPDAKSGLSGGRRENFSGKDLARMPKLTVAPQIPKTEAVQNRRVIKNTIPLTLSGISKDTVQPFSALRNTEVIARSVFRPRESRPVSQPAFAPQIEQNAQQIAKVQQKIQSEVRIVTPKVSEFFASSNKSTPDSLKRLLTRIDSNPLRLVHPVTKDTPISVLQTTKQDIQPTTRITPEQTVAAYKSYVKEKAKQVHPQIAPVMQEQTFKEPAVVREMEQASKVLSLIKIITENNPALTTIRTSLERQTLVSVDQNITLAVARKKRLGISAQPTTKSHMEEVTQPRLSLLSLLESQLELDEAEDDEKKKAKKKQMTVKNAVMQTNTQDQTSVTHLIVSDQPKIQEVTQRNMQPLPERRDVMPQVNQRLVTTKKSDAPDKKQPQLFEKDKGTNANRIDDVARVAQIIFPLAQEYGVQVDAAFVVDHLQSQTRDKTSNALLARYGEVFDITNKRFEDELRLAGTLHTPEEAVAAAIKAVEGNPAVQDGTREDVSEAYSRWVIRNAKTHTEEIEKKAA